MATVPMSLVMKGWQLTLPRRQQYALPPEQITAEMAERAGVEHAVDEHKAISLVNHFAYGTFAGMAYGGVSLLLAPTWYGGVVFGLLAWGGSYLGWLPLLGMRAAAKNEPVGRNAMMIVSHVVWGAVLGGFTAWAAQPGAP